MKRSVLAGLAVAMLVLAGNARAQEPPKDPDVFRIGALLAMSGKGDWYGKVMSQGIHLAIDEINADGGIDGIPLEVVIVDHESGLAEPAVAGMHRLINLYGVEAVLTSYSPPTLAVAPIADEQGILLLNGGGVSAKMIGASKYLFHNRSLSSDLGRAAARYAHSEGLKRMAQLAWKTAAGESVVKVVGPYWKQQGGEVVATEWMKPGEANIDTQIAKIRSSNPDWVALWLFSPDPGLAMKRIRQFGMDVPVIGIEYTPDVQKLGGEYMEGYHYTSDYFKPSDEYPWSQQFAKSYKEKYGEEPGFYAANYYEGVYVIAEAIRRARAEGGDYWEGARLASAIRENPTFKSIYGGEMTFQENGVAQKRVALFRVDNGMKKFVKYISLE